MRMGNRERGMRVDRLIDELTMKKVHGEIRGDSIVYFRNKEGYVEDLLDFAEVDEDGDVALLEE